MNRSRLDIETLCNLLPKLALPLLLAVVFGYGWHPIAGGEDFWAHAAIGRWTMEHGQVPRHTLFLWSENIPWIAHAYGTGIIFYELLNIGGATIGPYLALIVTFLCCAAPFGLLWMYWRKKSPFCSLVPPLFVLAIWVSSARFHPRPEIFTALFLSMLLIFLCEWPRREKLPIPQIIGVLLMFIIWPNLHGAVAIGLVVLWISALSELIQGRDARLLGLAVVCTLLLFGCNPRGLEYYKVLSPIASKTFLKIDEWKPFWKWPALGWDLVIGEVLLWLVGMLLWANNPNRRLAQLGWMLLMGAAFLKARRQLWLTAITSLAVIASNSENLESNALFRGWRRLTKGDAEEAIPVPMRFITRAGVLVILICAACQAIPRNFLTMSAVDQKLPVKMADFLLTKAPQGRILNDYEYSAYLEWALHDKRKLYIDLNNAYPDTLMDEYFQVLDSSKKRAVMKQDEAKRAAILARRKIGIVTLRPYSAKEGLSILGKYLDKNPNWKRIYKEDDGTVWKRITGES
jgi:hypothetical protein